jgi:hypothetical protein
VLPIRFSFQPGQLSTDTSRRNPLPSNEVAETAAPSEESAEATPTDRYVFNCSQLGWLNVDRPVSAGTIALLALTTVDEATTVRLVLPGITPIVVAAEAAESGYQFNNLPTGRRAVLIGLRYSGGLPSFAWQEVTTGQAAPVPLEFKETTLEELERRLEQL